MVAGAFLLVTCEHGGNRVPKEYRRLFAGWESVLASHRGYDPGALTLARELARAFDAPLVASTVTRLLIELNRSPGHPQLHSEVTRDLPRSEKARIAARYYEPYRREVEQRVAEATAARRRVRRNYPYRGYADGLTTHLRRRYGRRYVGVEIEVNQKHVLAGARQWRMLREVLVQSVGDIVYGASR